jgi:hypothetical protein
MVNGNNGNDKYSSSNEMSLASLLGRVHRHGASSSISDPLRSVPISQQRRNGSDNLQDILEQALELSSDDTPSLDSSDALAPSRSRRNHQNRNGDSADSHSGHDARAIQ